MEILSSLKSIPGKIVNLQSENFINEELNKTLKYPEGKKTTSSSISKVSKDFFCDPLEEKINNKKLNTTNSVFKPVALFPQYPQKKSTMNYYPFNTLMSFPDLGLQNQIQNGPPKITNSSFSKNSFYMMNQNNAEPNMNLFNQINLQGNQINTSTQINQINQSNFFNSNPFNSFNAINIINPTNLNFQNLNAQIPVNDIYLSKNNLSNYQNKSINNKININNDSKKIKEKFLSNINSNEIISSIDNDSSKNENKNINNPKSYRNDNCLNINLNKNNMNNSKNMQNIISILTTKNKIFNRNIIKNLKNASAFNKNENNSNFNAGSVNNNNFTSFMTSSNSTLSTKNKYFKKKAKINSINNLNISNHTNSILSPTSINYNNYNLNNENNTITNYSYRINHLNKPNKTKKINMNYNYIFCNNKNND
jgi:hypothetical protein